MELYASGIYPKIFTRIDSLFKAGEGTLSFLRKFDEMAYSALLKPLRGKQRTAPRGVSTSFAPSSELNGRSSRREKLHLFRNQMESNWFKNKRENSRHDPKPLNLKANVNPVPPVK